MDANIAIEAEGLSVKYVRTLDKAMVYACTDIFRDLVLAPDRSDRLRPHEFWGLDEVSFQVRKGECLGIIGRNGAGKSTLLKAVSGILKPDRGRISVRGRVGVLIELGAGFHPLLTGRENIYVNGAILGLSKKEIAAKFDEIVAFSELEAHIDSPVKYYSSGMFVRLGFAVAAHLNPDVLLLDEVLAVGDIAFQAKCFNKIGEIRNSGSAMILISHNMHSIAGFCDRVMLMNTGRTEFTGDPREAIAAYMVSGMKPAVVTGSEDGKALGSGAITIDRVEFIDLNGLPTGSIKSGSGITVRVHYTAGRKVLDPILDMAIQDSAMGNFFQITSRELGARLGELEGSGYLDLVFPRLISNNQVLSFFFAWWNSSHTELYDWKRDLKLPVTGNPMSSGRVLLECSIHTHPERQDNKKGNSC